MAQHYIGKRFRLIGRQGVWIVRATSSPAWITSGVVLHATNEANTHQTHPREVDVEWLHEGTR